jgi:hypothetical protein
MDAAITAHPRLAELGGQTEITGITLRCNPLVPELMGREQPRDGLESRFSARHGVAVSLLYGRAGLAEFSDAAATAPRSGPAALADHPGRRPFLNTERYRVSVQRAAPNGPGPPGWPPWSGEACRS